MLNNMGLPGLIVTALVFGVPLFLILRALLRIGSKK